MLFRSLIDRPDVKGREAILAVHAKDKPLNSDVDLEILAKRTPGFTGADLANLINEAALLTVRRNKTQIGMNELEESIERVLAGPEKKNRIISDEEKRLTAYHEAGHAMVGFIMPHGDKLHKISIIPRGRAGGYTLLLPEEDRNYVTKSHMLNEIAILLGGRVSESIFLNDISTGAQNDLERASNIVRKMIMEYGMSEELGSLTFGHKNEEVFLGRDISRDRNYSDAIAYAIDKEAARIMEEAYAQAEKILREHAPAMHQVASVLLEQEVMNAEEFEAIVNQYGNAAAIPLATAETTDNGSNAEISSAEQPENPSVDPNTAKLHAGRDAGQVADRPQPLPLGEFARHHEGIGVREPPGGVPFFAVALLVLPDHDLQRLPGVRRHRQAQLPGQGRPGVHGPGQVDVPVVERPADQDGGPEVVQQLHPDPQKMAPDHLGGYLGQDLALGRVAARYDDAALRGVPFRPHRKKRRARQDRQEEEYKSYLFFCLNL